MLHKFLNDFLALAPLQLPELINQERMEHDYKSATAIALVMLAASFLILFLVNMVQHRNAKILKGGR